VPAFVLILLVVAASPAGAEWAHPVDGDIVDGFRPPATRFSAGNRGLEYGTSGGEIVRAVDAGVVVFAGSVGGQRHVVVDHGDGLRSTSAFVSGIAVVRGQRVAKGQRLAIADAGFHLTARLGSSYVDPMELIHGAEVVVRLVAGALPRRPSPLRSADRGRGPDPWFAVLDAAADLRLVRQYEALANAAAEWHRSDCTDDATVVAGPRGSSAMGRRVLVQVGGLGTSSEAASIGALDHGALGYDADNVVGFSYAGGCTPTAFAGGTGNLNRELGGSPYGPIDTFQAVDVSANHLADLIDRLAAARPGRPIDIAAHSLGGVVAQRAIEMLSERGRADPIDVVLTIGAPHGGADLATAAAATAGSRGVATHLDPLIGGGADFRGAESVLDIAEDWRTPGPASPPDGVTVVAVAGASDLVVPAEHGIWEGATNVVVPTSLFDAASVHGALPAMTEVRREMELALAGAPPRCIGLVSVLGAALEGRSISALEDSMTLLVGLARWVF
jgi:hypothetical protein